ncbi:thioredoxin domain-containing protein, partial [Patescibacteria group bacterium]|nr:thioredoxin domain-containing protein [Patescibacteria group bacterium]
TNTIAQTAQFTNSEPTFGKIGDYYFRGQQNPLLDIVFYSENLYFYESIMKVLNNYPSYTRLIWKHFPLTAFHINIENIAEALECAGEQGKFWQYIDNIGLSDAYKDVFTGIDGQTDSYFAGIDVTSIGLSQDQYSQCVLTEKYKEYVTNIYNESLVAGVSGTPSTVVNENKALGANEDDLLDVIHDEFKKKLMQNWEMYNDPDFNFTFLYPGTIQINKVSNLDDDLQRVDLVDKQSDIIYQIYYYKKGQDARLTDLKNTYDIEQVGLYYSKEINQNRVRFFEQLMTMKDGSETKSKIDIGYLDTDIIDGFLTVVDELSIEIWGPNSDFSSEFIKILSFGVEISKINAVK